MSTNLILWSYPSRYILCTAPLLISPQMLRVLSQPVFTAALPSSSLSHSSQFTHLAKFPGLFHRHSFHGFSLLWRRQASAHSSDLGRAERSSGRRNTQQLGVVYRPMTTSLWFLSSQGAAAHMQCQARRGVGNPAALCLCHLHRLWAEASAVFKAPDSNRLNKWHTRGYFKPLLVLPFATPQKGCDV